MTAPFLRVMRRTHRETKQLIKVSTEIRTSNHRFNEMLRRSTVDLAMLLTETPQGLYPYAGIPWYSTTFGRDGLITALQCLWLDRRIRARGAATPGGDAGGYGSMRPPMPRPARFCMRPAPARWRG